MVERCELHAPRAGDETEILMWRAEGLALQGKHEAVIESLASKRARLTVDADYAEWFESRWVRSLTKLKRYDEAMAVARASTARDGDPYFELIVASAKGDVEACVKLMRTLAEQGYDAASFWDDDEIGAALDAPAFARVRKEFPKPEEE